MSTRRERERREERYNSSKERAEKHAQGNEPTCIIAPEGCKFFRLKQVKTYRLDHLPYYVGRGNPFCDEGFVHYERTYYAHGIPTPVGFRTYCCPAKISEMAKEKVLKCPICEHVAKLRRDGGMVKADIDKMDAKEKQLFNLIDLDNKEDGVQIWNFNWWEYGKLIDDKCKKKDAYAKFYHREGGSQFPG